MIDSAAPVSHADGENPADPASLAALARELAANDWQVRELITADGGAGSRHPAADRNVVLAVEWPRLARLPRRSRGPAGTAAASRSSAFRSPIRPGRVESAPMNGMFAAEFPVQRGEVVAGLHRPGTHRAERCVVVDHRADDRQVPA